jgi:cytochrome c biogenesis protein CcmG/thiol:disulfide interchange protein DsbE
VNRSLRISLQAAAVGAVAGLLALLIWKIVNGGVQNLQRAERVPGFTLPRLGAPGHLSLASLRGKVVVLNFWASWCDPCKTEAPLLERSWRRWRSQGVVFVGIDQADFKSDAHRFLERYGITYPNVFDGPETLVNPYGLTGRPETYVVRRDGALGEHFTGVIHDVSALDAQIEKALQS